MAPSGTAVRISRQFPYVEPVRHLTFVAERSNSLWLEGTRWRRRMSPIHLHLLLNDVPVIDSVLGVLPGFSEAVAGATGTSRTLRSW